MIVSKSFVRSDCRVEVSTWYELGRVFTEEEEEEEEEEEASRDGGKGSELKDVAKHPRPTTSRRDSTRTDFFTRGLPSTVVARPEARAAAAGLPYLSSSREEEGMKAVAAD